MMSDFEEYEEVKSGMFTIEYHECLGLYWVDKDGKLRFDYVYHEPMEDKQDSFERHWPG